MAAVVQRTPPCQHIQPETTDLHMAPIAILNVLRGLRVLLPHVCACQACWWSVCQLAAHSRLLADVCKDVWRTADLEVPLCSTMTRMVSESLGLGYDRPTWAAELEKAQFIAP